MSVAEFRNPNRIDGRTPGSSLQWQLTAEVKKQIMQDIHSFTDTSRKYKSLDSGLRVAQMLWGLCCGWRFFVDDLHITFFWYDHTFISSLLFHLCLSCTPTTIIALLRYLSQLQAYYLNFNTVCMQQVSLMIYEQDKLGCQPHSSPFLFHCGVWLVSEQKKQ